MARKPLPKYLASFNKVLSIYKRNARNRNLKFDLSTEEFRRICEERCSYCGAPPENNNPDHLRLNGSWKYNGLDRIDSTQGYVEGNVQPCCTMCNRLKSDLEEEVFLRHITRIVKKMS